MVSTLALTLTDSSTMLRRVLRHTTRNPSTLIMSVILPGLLLLLLNFGFGGAINIREGQYLDYLVPGILLMGASYSVSATAVAVAADCSQGIVERFRTMAVARASVLTGHVLGSLLRTMLGTMLVILLAIAIGLRPTTNPAHWIEITGLVALLLFSFAWVATGIGLATATTSGAASLAGIFQILPFLSGAFVPTDTMPGWLQAFTTNQPMTPIVSALRGLLTDTATGSDFPIAVAWCGGIAITGYLFARRAYNRRTTG